MTVIKGSKLSWLLRRDGSAVWGPWRVVWSEGVYRLLLDGEGFVFSARTGGQLDVFIAGRERVAEGKAAE